MKTESKEGLKKRELLRISDGQENLNKIREKVFKREKYLLTREGRYSLGTGKKRRNGV